uniref:Septin 14 n=1 Tax=Jaculus jaculus TaxID=51337 RepID=A0A8C5KJQ5_JACJA
QNENIRCLTTRDHFGFECLPTQLVTKSLQKGFTFNILCVGETGIGKSTLINTLFNTNLKDSKSSHFYSNVGLKVKTYELLERNVPLKLTIVKTVGYGDQLSKEASYKPVVEYIDAQFELYLQEELKIKRSLADFHDSRIHVCLYFIAPTGHSLKTLDLITMKSIDSKVNIIPLIAKADALSKSDLQRFKSNVMRELISSGIRLYQFPAYDETSAQASASVENENHCDLVKLRDILLCTNMEDLKEQTHTYLYESYRSNKLQKLGFTDVGPDNQPVSFQELYKAKRQEFYDQCKKEEAELKQRFMQRVKEKEATFKDAEKE